MESKASIEARKAPRNDGSHVSTTVIMSVGSRGSGEGWALKHSLLSTAGKKGRKNMMHQVALTKDRREKALVTTTKATFGPVHVKHCVAKAPGVGSSS